MNEDINRLNPDELETVTGGYSVNVPGNYEQKFAFTQEEMNLLQKGICPKCGKTFALEAIFEHLRNCQG